MSMLRAATSASFPTRSSLEAVTTKTQAWRALADWVTSH